MPNLMNAFFKQDFIQFQFLFETVEQFCEEFHCRRMMDNVYQWKLLPNSNENPAKPRLSTTINRLIVFGDEFRSPPENRKTEIYCPQTNQWKLYNKFTCDRHFFCSILIDNELFILGGYSFEKQALASVSFSSNFINFLPYLVSFFLSEG